MTIKLTQADRLLVPGPAGTIEVVVEVPEHTPIGIALVAHPHPLFGGTLDNKVTQTLARALRDLSYVALRPNFRGVGASEGAHDEGLGETEDMLSVLDAAYSQWGGLPVVLAGFSFGAYVQTRVAQRIKPEQLQRMVLVGTAAGFVEGARIYPPENVPANTLVIHGERDETVPLANVLDWARPQDLPIVLVPGADHFFHRRLHILKDIIHRAWGQKLA